MIYMTENDSKEQISIENIKNGIHKTRLSCFNEVGVIKSRENTCKITDNMIDNISFFLSHKLPKCKYLNISLENIKNGKIISRGSFGFSFLIIDNKNNKKIIKIIVANNISTDDLFIDDDTNPSDNTSFTKKIKKEIEIHNSISLINNNNFIKLFGYFVKEEHKSIVGNKLSYNYYNIENKINCNIRSTKFDDFNELYLVMEAGETDLYNIKTGVYQIEINELTNLFIKLIEFYKISENFIKTQNKIFIHSDIKPQNIVLVDTGITKQLKLIDFGISLLSDNFYDEHAYGTMYMYYYLYFSSFRQNKEIYRRSPLSDIFAVIISFIEIILYKYGKFNILERSKGISFDELETILKTIFDDIIPPISMSELTKNNIMRLLNIGRVIYTFYKPHIDIFDHKRIINSKTTEFNDIIAEFKKNTDIENLNFVTPRNYVHKPPVYDNDKRKTKLQNDYEYLDKIITYFIKSETYFDLNQDDYRSSSA